MVVACRTQQFIKSKKISFSTSSFPFTSRNFYNYTKNVPSIISTTKILVRLCCACRRFHSTEYFQTPRESRAGLSPQEFFLVNANFVMSLDISVSLEQNQTTIIPSNPIVELPSVIVNDLLNSSAPSHTKSFIQDSNQDLLEYFVRSYTADPRIKEAASNNDIQSLLDVFNSDIGGTVLVISNSDIVLDIDAVERVLINRSSLCIKKLYIDNIVMQFVANSFIQDKIRSVLAQLKPVLSEKIIPVETVKNIISVMGKSRREKRDLLVDLILFILRPIIAAFLTPIQTQLNTVLNSTITHVLTQYSPIVQNSPVVGIFADFVNIVVFKIAEVIVSFQVLVNSIFNNVITGSVFLG